MSTYNHGLTDPQHAAFKPVVPLWRNRDYLLLWGGQVVAVTGAQVSNLAFPLLILAITHSPEMAGLAGALRTVPYVLVALPAGVWVDRLNRKYLMICCDIGRFFCMASIIIALLFGQLTFYHILIVSFIDGVLFVLFDIAEVSCLPQVIAKEQLASATAQNIATYNISALLGSPLGGLLYSINLFLPFVAHCVTYLVSVLSLFFMKTSFRPDAVEQTRSMKREILQGLQWLWRQKLFRFLAMMMCGINLVFEGLTLIIIVLAQHLRATPVELGLLFSVAGVAGILGSMVAPILRKRMSFASLIIGTLWPQAILLPMMIIAPNLWVLGMINALLFFVFPIFDIVQRSQRLAKIPDGLQGRVNSVYRLIAFSGRPLSMAATGVLLQRSGVVPTTWLVTGGMVILALLATFNPDVRHADE